MGLRKYVHFKVGFDIFGNRGEINWRVGAVKSDTMSRYRYLHRHMILAPVCAIESGKDGGPSRQIANQRPCAQMCVDHTGQTSKGGQPQHAPRLHNKRLSTGVTEMNANKPAPICWYTPHSGRNPQERRPYKMPRARDPSSPPSGKAAHHGEKV